MNDIPVEIGSLRKLVAIAENAGNVQVTPFQKSFIIRIDNQDIVVKDLSRVNIPETIYNKYLATTKGWKEYFHTDTLVPGDECYYYKNAIKSDVFTGAPKQRLLMQLGLLVKDPKNLDFVNKLH